MMLHLGFALSLGNWASVALVALGLPPLFVYRIRVEERALAARLGTSYTQYMTRTKRLIPGVW